MLNLRHTRGNWRLRERRDFCRGLRYSDRMRTIGRSLPELTPLPKAEGLRRAAEHQAGARALSRISSTGIARGVYRFKSHEEADAQVNEGLARVMAANAALQVREP